MNQKVLLIGIVLILVGIGVGIFLILTFIKPSGSTVSQNPVTFPGSNVATSSVSTGGSTQQMSLVTQTGSVQVNDFLHNGETIPDVENTGNYLLAGNLGYCLPNIRCSAATTTDFNIGYDSKAQAFTIALLKEPIGNARKEAEAFLMSRLGISQQQLCSLNYYVGTTYFVNESYDSGNLGFSFCPGAVALP